MTVEYNFLDHISGTVFAGVTFNVSVNGMPLNLSGATISAIFNDGQYTLSTTNSGITIDSPLLGTFSINSQLISWRKDRYRYYITFTLEDGSVKRYIQGICRIE